MTSRNKQELLDRVYDQFDYTIKRVKDAQKEFWLNHSELEDAGQDFPLDDPRWRFFVNYYSYDDIAEGILRKLREERNRVRRSEDYLDETTLLNVYEGLQDIAIIAEELDFWIPEEDKIDGFLGIYNLLGYIQLLLRTMRRSLELAGEDDKYEEAAQFYENQRNIIKEYMRLDIGSDSLLENRTNFIE